MRRFVTFGPALLVLLTTALVLAAAPGTLRAMQFSGIQAQVQNARVSLAGQGELDTENRELSDIADAVLPSVVHLGVRIGNRWRGVSSNGSGWLYDEQGHIVTNAHVVANAAFIRAELYDGRVEQAEVVGIDLKTDIAVLRIDPGAGVVAMERAENDSLRIGHRAFAFGSPFGIKFSMSGGLVSGMGRSDGASFVRGIAGYTNYIQSDAAINPGNSGGPLVDVNGKLVGMNTSIANAPSRSEDGEGPRGQSAGIGFAIPVETIESVVAQLLSYEVVLRGYLGMRPSDQIVLRDPNTGEVVDRGVEVGGVPADEPAFRGGLRPGDLITTIDGKETPDFSVLRSVVSVLKPGTLAEVRVIREREELLIPVRIGAAVDVGSGLRYVPNSESMTPAEIRRSLTQTED